MMYVPEHARIIPNGEAAQKVEHIHSGTLKVEGINAGGQLNRYCRDNYRPIKKGGKDNLISLLYDSEDNLITNMIADVLILSDVIKVKNKAFGRDLSHTVNRYCI